MKKHTSPYLINSVSDLHRLLELPKPEHPLVSMITLDQIKCFSEEHLHSVVYNFYSICIKKDYKGKLKYGQRFYDFDEGVMTFFSPGQVVSTEITGNLSLSGWWLVIHPDFLRPYTLSGKIREYGYFSYAVSEALHLSEKEEAMIYSIMANIAQEYRSMTDQFSQDLMISHIELLLNYANRFYHRQFITRKQGNDDLLIRLEEALARHFEAALAENKGLPTVQGISKELNVSPDYLSDMLRTTTGQNTQQHIHQRLIEKAKKSLSTTQLSVSEIAYQLGFEHPQSFSKLFRNKTNTSPLEFRHSFN